MGLKIFITGTGGYLGSVLTSDIAGMPEVERVTGIDNKVLSSPPSDKINYLKMDIRSQELADAMAGYDVVIHTAGIVQWSAKMSKALRDDINLNGTRNVAQAAAKNKVHRFIQASSVAAYTPFKLKGLDNIDEDSSIGTGNSSLYYWNTKSKTERILSDILGSSNVILTLLRLGTVIGPRSPITVHDLRRDAVLFRDCNPRTQYIHEDDAVQAFIQAIRTDMPGAYNVVTDDFIRMSEFFDVIGAEPKIVSLWFAIVVSYIQWRFFGSHIHPSWIKSYQMDSTLTNAKLKTTGWKPKYNNVEAVRSILE